MPWPRWPLFVSLADHCFARCVVQFSFYFQFQAFKPPLAFPGAVYYPPRANDEQKKVIKNETAQR
jgi:hypothetical protein